MNLKDESLIDRILIQQKINVRHEMGKISTRRMSKTCDIVFEEYKESYINGEKIYILVISDRIRDLICKKHGSLDKSLVGIGIYDLLVNMVSKGNKPFSYNKESKYIIRPKCYIP